MDATGAIRAGTAGFRRERSGTGHRLALRGGLCDSYLFVPLGLMRTM
ncbi:hypothetical protein SVIOM342S_04280 [Streptomyces violaceorubidus]